MKTAITIIADPKSGTEEASARAFNALALALESKKAGDQVEVSFIGTGTRWPAELTKLTHPFHALFDEVRDVVIGASCGCAAAFGAIEGVQASGVKLSTDNAILGTPGLLSLRRYATEGWTAHLF